MYVTAQIIKRGDKTRSCVQLMINLLWNLSITHPPLCVLHIPYRLIILTIFTNTFIMWSFNLMTKHSVNNPIYTADV